MGISFNTRGLDEKVIAIIIGASQFLASLMVFIVSAKVPQWVSLFALICALFVSLIGFAVLSCIVCSNHYNLQSNI